MKEERRNRERNKKGSGRGKETDWVVAKQEGRQSGCCTRVCQCLPVSTPTYLCKSFNLTPPYRWSRERSYLETYSYSLPGRWGEQRRPIRRAAIRSRFPCLDATTNHFYIRVNLIALAHAFIFFLTTDRWSCSGEFVYSSSDDYLMLHWEHVARYLVTASFGKYSTTRTQFFENFGI